LEVLRDRIRKEKPLWVRHHSFQADRNLIGHSCVWAQCATGK
jgi:hypothetical protein